MKFTRFEPATLASYPDHRSRFLAAILFTPEATSILANLTAAHDNGKELRHV